MHVMKIQYTEFASGRYVNGSGELKDGFAIHEDGNWTYEDFEGAFFRIKKHMERKLLKDFGYK